MASLTENVSVIAPLQVIVTAFISGLFGNEPYFYF